MSNVPPPIPPQQPDQSMPPAMPQPVLSYAGSESPDHNRLRNTAKWQHYLNLTALLWILVFFVLYAFFTAPRGKTMPTELILPRMILSLFLLASWVGMIVFMILLTVALDNAIMAIIMGILAVIPIFNLIPVAIQSQRATGRLRKAGYKVGLMGANLKQFAQ